MTELPDFLRWPWYMGGPLIGLMVPPPPMLERARPSFFRYDWRAER